MQQTFFAATAGGRFVLGKFNIISGRLMTAHSKVFAGKTPIFAE